jgi:hypothetical protein
MRSGGALDVEEFAQAIDHFVLKCSPPSSPDTPQTPIQPADADDGEQDGMQPEDFERYMRVKAAEVRPLERTLSAVAVAQLMVRKCSVSGRGLAIAQKAA